ncbi:hypothetical protein [Sphingopyxis fribergensis]
MGKCCHRASRLTIGQRSWVGDATYGTFSGGREGALRADESRGAAMPRSVSVAAIMIAAATPALGQTTNETAVEDADGAVGDRVGNERAGRADENAVRAAGDAFGTSVGNEKIGLYGVGDVRGFSPATAGNIRVEGLSVTEHGGFSSRIASGSTIRVGLTAQGYAFPAPTGIADYSLRSAGDDAVLSPILYFGPNRTAAVDIDAQIPIVRGRLGLAAGVAYRYEENFSGEDSQTLQGGGVLSWRPSDRIEFKSFYGRAAIMDDLDIGNIFTGGPYFPPKIERRYFGLDWTQTEVRRQFYGGTSSVQLSGAWQIRTGLFRSENHVLLNPVELYRDVQRDGTARRQVVVTQDQTAKSTSGDFRSSYAITEGARRHSIHLAIRGRDTKRTYGGGDVRDLGPAVIGERIDLPEPDFDFGPLTRDEVRQVTGGIGYELRWPAVAELSLGIQKTDYQKTVRIPGRPILVTKDKPWLYNGALAVHVTKKLVAYAGYTRGLEDSATAPSDAVNRNSAPPALRTSQRDAGLRYAIRPGLNLVAGLFDVRKPYFNLDPDRVYRKLGTVRHRGVELSLAGQPAPGLSIIVGAVLLDADVSGEAVDFGIIGPKPVGTTARIVRANFDYRLPFFTPLSVDLGITSQTKKVASAFEFVELGGKQLMTGPLTTVDIGVRYRFETSFAPATLRAQVTNLFDAYGWNVSSNSSFKFNDTRRFLITLATDI